MKFVDEYRDRKPVALLAQELRRIIHRPWTIMEICGGQTHTILKSGLEDLLPPEVTLVHGPGCPVCVTPIELIDKAVEIAARPEAILCSFGDMLRVPGSTRSLLDSKAAGGDVRMVYSPMDALKVAHDNPRRQVVFFAVGFETTAPANAMSVWQAARAGLENFSLLVAHVLVPPAIEAILSAPNCRVQAFLAPGHVCTVMGYQEYEPLAQRYRVPIVVTGFEPLDLLEGICMAVAQLEEGRAEVENQYSRAVSRDGNQPAPAAHGRGLRGHQPPVARHRRDSLERPAAPRPLPPLRRRGALRAACRGRARSPPTASAAWCCRASRSPMSARPSAFSCTPETPARRAHGLLRRRLLRVLSVREARSCGRLT